MSKVLLGKTTKLLLAFTGISLVVTTILINLTPTHAEDLDYNITIQPSLNVTTSATDISLKLNPATNPFESKNLTVSVGTNNETGYKLYVSSINNTTNLVEENDPNLYIETLSSEVSENDFTANRWGYKLDSTNEKYVPFTTGNILVNYSYYATNNTSSTLSFAAKAGYNTKPGTYNLALSFKAITNPNIPWIQDYTKETCQKEASANSVIVQDKRDNNEYSVRYINGNCWMVQNLRFSGTELSSTTSNVEEKYTDENPYQINDGGGWGNIAESDSFNQARLYSGKDGQNHDGNVTVWYNYTGASAGTTTGASSSSNTPYDICPANWRMPNSDEAKSIFGYHDAFKPVAGGYYNDGVALSPEAALWWTTTPAGTTGRYALYFTGSSITNGVNNRGEGIYLRCIRSN